MSNEPADPMKVRQGERTPAEVTSGPSRNPASAVYGTVLAGSLIAAEGARDSVDIPRLLGTVLVTQLVFWLAHVYADLVGQRVRSGRRPHWPDVRALLREEWSLVAASYGPLLAVGIAYVLGYGASSAVLAGLWATTAVLVLWAVLAGRRGRMRGAELALYVVLSGAFGCALVLLKALLH
jgi:small-conductance mechanosensitive channel